MLLAVIVVFIDHAKNETRNSYIKQLEKNQEQIKIDSLQKDLDYLVKEDCKNIVIRAININNEVKEVGFIKTGTIGNQKYIAINLDGKPKNFDYNTFMTRVFKIECGDDYKW